MIKQITNAIKRTTYALSNKLKIGESSKYAILTIKATILDKSDIIFAKLDWIEAAYFMRNLFSYLRLYEITKRKC
jgi:hypothetical protein